jgi:transcriptional regulator with XRE-family HTH domain
MRKSPKRHNLARLRLFLKLTQEQMAKLAACSRRAVQSVELGQLTLSEGLARRVTAATGVHLRWLLENDLRAPIVRGGSGRTWDYTRADFDAAQAAEKFGDDELSREIAADYAVSFYGQIRAILSSAAKKNLTEVATWKIAKFLDDCRWEFGHDTRMIGSEEQFGLRDDDSPYLKHRQVNAGIALFKKYDQERRRVIKEHANLSRRRTHQKVAK